MVFKYDVDMSAYTSFRAGGKVRRLAIAENVQELQALLSDLHRSGESHLLIGNGSNTLFAADMYPGTVVKLGESFSDISLKDDTLLVCGASALMSRVASAALENSLSGFEFASGIPGSIGGAVFMNAGAYGGEMKDIVELVNVVSADGRKLETLRGEELDLSYRHSVLEETGDVVVSVGLRLTKGEKSDIRERMSELTRQRNEKQPVQYPSAGSFFKRPAGHFAGKLVEDAGLKGISVGGAQVSPKHAGFVVNTGGATYQDIIDLMHLVQNTVQDRTGVKLEPEVRIIDEKYGRNKR